jgi:hypothetical protein
MRLRSHRRDLLPSNLFTPPGKSGPVGPARLRRIRWWLRTGVLLSVIGIRRLAQTCWQHVFLVTGVLVFAIGLTLLNSVAVVFGMLVMGSAVSGTAPHSPDAAMVRAWMWLHKGRAGNP